MTWTWTWTALGPSTQTTTVSSRDSSKPSTSTPTTTTNRTKTRLTYEDRAPQRLERPAPEKRRPYRPDGPSVPPPFRHRHHPAGGDPPLNPELPYGFTRLAGHRLQFPRLHRWASLDRPRRIRSGRAHTGLQHLVTRRLRYQKL